jgi:hypothetical protein
MCRADLVDAYLSAMKLTSIAVIGAGKQARIETGEPPPGELIQAQFYFRPSHAELVLATIGRDGMTDKPAPALVASIKQAAATLGAPYKTPGELRSAAECRVAAIVARVKASGRALKPWNARYRQYRLAQVAKCEKAIPYAAYIEQAVIAPTVRSFAAGAG